jgi:hypothetical protein
LKRGIEEEDNSVGCLKGKTLDSNWQKRRWEGGRDFWSGRAGYFEGGQAEFLKARRAARVGGVE